MNFSELPIDINLKNTLKNSNFINPTPIQSKSIPDALMGKDILGTAQTVVQTSYSSRFCPVDTRN